MATIAQAILEINPNAEVSINNDNIDNIIWNNGTPKISKSDIQAKMDEIEIRDAHIRPRRKSYPSIVNQLDYIYHHGITKWKTDLIKPIKDANPKENE